MDQIIKDSPDTEQYAMGVSPLSESYKAYPIAINVQRISLIHEKLHFLCSSVRGVLYDLINVLAPFQSFCKHEIIIKLNSTIPLGLEGGKKSQ